MTRFQLLRRAVLMCLLVVPLIISGCGSSTKGGKMDSDDQLENEMDLSYHLNHHDADTMQERMVVTIYALDRFGYVTPVSFPLENSADVARKTLEHMVVGGPGEDYLPVGFSGIIPEDTEVIGIDIDQGIATVDFSKSFANYERTDERKLLEAVTWALTGFPTVERVQIWVNGTPLKQMPVAGTPLDAPLTRNIGINLENFDQVQLSQAVPVTLYFRGQAPDQFHYFVPVTRFVRQTNDISGATLRELIKGPNRVSALHEVIEPEVELMGINQSDDLITVSLDDRMVQFDQQVAAEALQSIILSLTENTGDYKVQIKVNGIAKFESTDQADYNVPVARPTHINAVKS